MAEVRGRKCDRQGCDTLVTDSGPNMPNGWVQCVPKTDKPDDKPMEYCSNYCVAHIFVTRYEAETGVRFQRPKGEGFVALRDSNKDGE